ncbi:nuclear transport factor 2 family protein [Polaribacter reichenbachii]|nr:nuclear transport factor 2 family protein [Polaribacter reichenbachii]
MNSFIEAFRDSFIIKVFIAIIMFLHSFFTSAQIEEIPEYKIVNTKLYSEIVKMDSIYFTAYNKCDIKTQASIYNENIEFFHDKGGLATDKKQLLKSIEENICNKVTRTLIKGSLEVYPIHNYGAIEIGYHKFYNEEEPNAKSVPSKFIVTWKKENENWTITKVISLH